MGVRHALGVLSVDAVKNVYLSDINIEALDNAKRHLEQDENSYKLKYLLTENIDNLSDIDVGIIAATATDRKGLCELAISVGCKTLLIEKPLGQSLKEVKLLIDFLLERGVTAYANLNMRIYPDSIKLRNDLNTLKQFQGYKIITLNSGSVGIGANGIHYLDYLFYLTKADSYKIVNSYISDTTIFSARGPQFKDFGGWILIKLLSNNNEVATAFLSINPESTVFGGWDIVGSHGRITINECDGKRIDYLRNENSIMPIQRYNADYNQPVISNFESPMLSILTKNWIQSLIESNCLLPTLEKAYLSHELLFEWLGKAKGYKEIFPIT